MKTLILGLGNELYGDDGIGIYIIQRLEKEKAKSEENSTNLFQGIHLEACALTGLSLLDVITGYDRLIIIDTIKREDPETGRIHLLNQSDLRHMPGPSPHYVSIPQAIEIGKQCGLRVPETIKIIAIESKNLYNLGESLTKEMEQAIPEIIDIVKNILKNG